MRASVFVRNTIVVFYFLFAFDFGTEHTYFQMIGHVENKMHATDIAIEYAFI